MWMIDYKDVGWWYWLVLAGLVNVSQYGEFDGYTWVIVVAAVHLLHYVLREASWTAFSVQVRLAFLAYVSLAYFEPLQWLYWVPAFGLIARVLLGYCLLARMLMLLPNNRAVALTWSFVANAFLAAPVRGSVLHGLGHYQNIGEEKELKSVGMR